MPTNPVKRVHTTERGKDTGSHKKVKPDSNEVTVANIIKKPIYVTSVEMNSQFDRFPEELRASLEEAHEKTTRHALALLRHGTKVEYKNNYSVVFGERDRLSMTGWAFERYQYSTPHESFANQHLLEQFLLRHPKGFGKVKFVELKDHEGHANAKLIHFHSVRQGEVGWGFDKFGCLSLYSVTNEDATVKDVVFYVDRYEIKKEADKEVEVIVLSDA